MPLQVQTTRFGAIEIAEDKIITLLGGLCGLPHCTRFIVIDPPGPPGPFRWLQCVDDSAAAFFLLDPAAFWPDYQPDIPAQACELLGLTTAEEAIVAAICVVPEDPRLMTANLAAPLIINPIRRTGIQLIVAESDFSVRQPVFTEPEATASGARESPTAAAAATPKGGG